MGRPSAMDAAWVRRDPFDFDEAAHEQNACQRCALGSGHMSFRKRINQPSERTMAAAQTAEVVAPAEAGLALAAERAFPRLGGMYGRCS